MKARSGEEIFFYKYRQIFEVARLPLLLSLHFVSASLQTQGSLCALQQKSAILIRQEFFALG